MKGSRYGPEIGKGRTQPGPDPGGDIGKLPTGTAGPDTPASSHFPMFLTFSLRCLLLCAAKLFLGLFCFARESSTRRAGSISWQCASIDLLLVLQHGGDGVIASPPIRLESWPAVFPAALPNRRDVFCCIHGQRNRELLLCKKGRHKGYPTCTLPTHVHPSRFYSLDRAIDCVRQPIRARPHSLEPQKQQNFE